MLLPCEIKGQITIFGGRDDSILMRLHVIRRITFALYLCWRVVEELGNYILLHLLKEMGFACRGCAALIWDVIAAEQPIGLGGQLADVLGCAVHVKRGAAFTFFYACSSLNALTQRAVAI